LKTNFLVSASELARLQIEFEGPDPDTVWGRGFHCDQPSAAVYHPGEDCTMRGVSDYSACISQLAGSALVQRQVSAGALRSPTPQGKVDDWKRDPNRPSIQLD